MNIDVKRKKFIEIAEKRVSNAVHSLSLIKKLSNKAIYDWDEVHVKQILSALRNEVRDIENSFIKRDSSKSDLFKFK